MREKLLLSLLLIGNILSAQTLPEPDALRRDIEKNFEKLQSDSLKDISPDDKIKIPVETLQKSDENISNKASSDIEVVLKSFLLKGNTIVTDEEIHQRLEPLINKNISFKKLKEVVSIIQRLYVDKGYIAKVYFPEQKISDGRVQVFIIEAKRGNVTKNPSSTSQMSELKLQEYVDTKLREGDLLNTIELYRAITILNELDGLRASSSLVKGIDDNSIDISIKADLKEKYTFFTSVDNYGTKYLGVVQNFISFGINDLLNYGLHDKLVLSTMISSGNKMGSLYYRFPVGTNGLKAGFNISRLTYSLGKDFEPLDIGGSSFSKGIHLNYPIINANGSRLNIEVEYDEIRSQSNTKEVETSNKTVRHAKTSLNFSNKDPFLSGAINQLHLMYVRGDLNINNDAEKLADFISANTDGAFSKLEFGYLREQKIDDQFELSFYFNTQKAFNNLNSGEKIALGGPHSIRAYPNGEISGDDGYFYNVDLKYRITNNFTGSIFYDYGRIKRDHQVWSNEASVQVQRISLDAAGAGFLYEDAHGFGAKIELATKINSNEAQDVNGNDSDGENNKYRVWLSARYNF